MGLIATVDSVSKEEGRFGNPEKHSDERRRAETPKQTDPDEFAAQIKTNSAQINSTHLVLFVPRCTIIPIRYRLDAGKVQNRRRRRGPKTRLFICCRVIPEQ
jgi:hypothetical protein